MDDHTRYQTESIALSKKIEFYTVMSFVGIMWLGIPVSLILIGIYAYTGIFVFATIAKYLCIIWAFGILFGILLAISEI